MRILITYYSNTGNTEKIAKSMAEGLAHAEVDIKPVGDTDPNSLRSYDLVLLGSGIYASKVSKEIVNLVKKTEELPENFVLFCTHASVTNYQNGFRTVKKAIDKVGSKIIAEWDCRGENLGMSEEQQKSMLAALPEAQRKKAEKDQKELKGHPNAEDLESAKNFALNLIL